MTKLLLFSFFLFLVLRLRAGRARELPGLAPALSEFAAVRNEMGGRFERIEARIDDVNTTLMRFGFGAIVTFVVGFAGVIATQL